MKLKKRFKLSRRSEWLGFYVRTNENFDMGWERLSRLHGFTRRPILTVFHSHGRSACDF